MTCMGFLDSTVQLKSALGTGGGGEVYLAYHKRLDMDVVLKVDKRDTDTPAEILRREVDVLKELHNDYIPQVYDYIVEGGNVVTVMEYIVGESLDRPLERGETFPQAQVIKWAKEILNALAYLHSPTHGEAQKGYVHSDIKPANIMRRPNGDISLIDFNIALAIGEASFVGLSPGYASPEHYGLDYSDPRKIPDIPAADVTPPPPPEKEASPHTTVLSDMPGVPDPGQQRGYDRYSRMNRMTRLTRDITPQPMPETENIVREQTPFGEDPAMTLGRITAKAENANVKKNFRKVTPDRRSDIYSLGATLYHLLSGEKPAQHAVDVIPLSAERFSKPLCDVINKAMRPNPDERFQTAEEMLAALDNLRSDDIRTKKLRKAKKLSAAVCSAILAAGLAVTFVGGRRIHNTNSALMNAEYSHNALEEGDVKKAVALALDGLPKTNPITNPVYRAAPLKVLTDALGVYELADSYKNAGVVKLPSPPLTVRLSQDGKTGACMCAGKLEIFSAENGSISAELDADPASVSEAEFIDNGKLVFAGADGLTCCDTSGKILWTGAPATAIAVSGDGRRVLAVYKDESSAALYDAATGKAIIPEMNFGSEHQAVDNVLNLDRNLLELNEDGSMMAMSFESNYVLLADLNTGNSVSLSPGSEYDYYFGGFAGDSLVLSFSRGSESDFTVIDCRETMRRYPETVTPFGIKNNRDGGIYIKVYGGKSYLSHRNIISLLDTGTGDSQVLVDSDGIIEAFDADGRHIISTDGSSINVHTAEGVSLFSAEGCTLRGLCAVRNNCAVYGNRDMSELKILRYEPDSSNTVAVCPTGYRHSYTKLTADKKYVVQYSVEGFRALDTDGNIVCEGTMPDPEKVYDMQFRRNEKGSYIEVLHKDGSVVCYDPLTGKASEEDAREKPVPAQEKITEYRSEKYLFEAPFTGNITVRDAKSGKKLREIEQEGYLTDMMFFGDISVMQFVKVGSDQLSEHYGVILDKNLNETARVPYFCDLLDGELIMDTPGGAVKKSKIYSVKELTELANKKLEELGS